MIETLGQKLYSSQEVSVYLGVCKTTLGNYAKKADIPRRFIHGVRYYTEEDIRKRLRKGRAEYENAGWYTYLIINDVRERAAAEAAAIMTADNVIDLLTSS